MSSSTSSAAILGSEGLGFSPDIESNSSFSGQEVYHSSNGHRPSLKSRSSVESLELPEEVITTEGLRHCDMVLNAKRYKKENFLDKLLEILQELRIPTWSDRTVSSNSSIKSFSSTSTLAWDLGPPEKSKVKIHKVSGSFTNAVFFISVPSEGSAAPGHKTLLLRIYGPSTSSLINRAAELRILHVLSSRYRIGPRVYGTFGNGRVEEYFESEALRPASLRDPQISRWIAVRMSELHRVDVRKAVDPVEWADPADGTRDELGVKRYLRNWIPAAKEVLKLLRDEEYKKKIDFDLFAEQWARYYKWVRDWEKENGEEKQSPRVFCHNDTQCGNLLMLKDVPPGKLPHQRIIVVDFEYASPNPAAFDIANQFCEWTSNYIGSNPETLNNSLFPTKSERDNFYLAYLQSGLVLDNITGGSSTTESPLSTPATSRRSSSAQLSTPAKTPPLAQFTPMTQMGPAVSPVDMELLEQQVERWVPASHALWSVWAIVQARDNVEQLNLKLDGKRGEDSDDDAPIEFDYLQYATGRIATFRATCQSMGVF